MKILEIAGSGSIGTNNMGPVSNDILQLSNYFHDLGHDVTLSDAKIGTPREALVKGVRLVETDSKPRATLLAAQNSKLPHSIDTLYRKISRYYKPWINEHKFVKDVAGKLDLRSFDIIHVHEVIPALILNKLYKAEAVYTAHTPSWCNPFEYKGLRGGVRKLQFSLLNVMGLQEIALIKNCLLTIALGDYLKEKIPEAVISVIPNGTNLYQWNQLDKREARKRMDISEDELVIIFVGRVSPVKGIDVLLNAIRLLSPQLANLKLIIIGSLSGSFSQRDKITPYAKMLMKKAKDLPVEFKGFISNRSEEFLVQLSAADLFVVPSLFEPQGIVVLEALSMELPVIASRTGGIPQMVTEDVGKLFEPGNHFELADHINELYNNRDKLMAMKGLCRKHIEENFSWRMAAEKHIKVFSKITKQKGCKE